MYSIYLTVVLKYVHSQNKLIYNGNRTEWCPIQSSDKQNRTTAKLESDLLITSVITDGIGRHEVPLPINHKNYNFREKEKKSSYEKRGKFALKY